MPTDTPSSTLPRSPQPALRSRGGPSRRPRVDTEFCERIPALSCEEKQQLEESILRDGCLAPLVTWGELIVDGHHRYEICERLGIAYTTVEVQLPDREAALDWIDRNALARRNLSPDQATLIRGRVYEREKQRQGEYQKRQFDAFEPKGKTASRLASEFGVSPRTIERDGAFARAVDALEDVAPDLPRAIMRGESPPRRDVIGAARIAEEDPERAAEILKPKPHVTHNSGEMEWYTPAVIVEAARCVLGVIDLDPSSNDVANETIKATRFFGVDDDGLKQPWSGRIFMNPPYASSLIGQFCARLIEHTASGAVTEAIVLTNNATETKWGHAILCACSAICFPAGRISCHRPDGSTATPLQGQMISYFGPNVAAFTEHFSALGKVLHG